MSKLSKDEILAKISEKIEDENTAIELLEDITDSFYDEEIESLKSTIEAKDSEISELKTRYKERFFDSGRVIETPKIESDTKTIIDIREI